MAILSKTRGAADLPTRTPWLSGDLGLNKENITGTGSIPTGAAFFMLAIIAFAVALDKKRGLL